MKLKDGFVLRNVAGSVIIVPTGERCMDFNGMITLNETGAFIWKCLEKNESKEEIVQSILKVYDVEKTRAETCVDDFIAKLQEAECLE